MACQLQLQTPFKAKCHAHELPTLAELLLPECCCCCCCQSCPCCSGVSLCSARLLLAFCVACFDFTLEMLSIASTKTCILRPCCMSAPTVNKFLAMNVGSSSSNSSRRRRVHQQHKQLQNEENNIRNCNAKKKGKAKAEKRKVQRKRAEKVSRMPRRHLKIVFMNRPAQAALQAGDGDVAGARAKVEAKANADAETETESKKAKVKLPQCELMPMN